MNLLPGLGVVGESQRARACRRKRAFVRWTQAERVAAYATQMFHRLQLAYRCASCSRWHISTVSIAGLRAAWERAA